MYVARKWTNGRTPWREHGVNSIYAQEMKYLVKPTSSWHFSARTAIPEDVDDFEMDDLAMDIAENASMVWLLLDVLGRSLPEYDIPSNISLLGNSKANTVIKLTIQEIRVTYYYPTVTLLPTWDVRHSCK